MYVQFGAGLCGPSGWENFDASPTVRLQRLPVVGSVGKLAGPVFPDNIQYGDITKGLPVPDGQVDGVYASHVLEHLSFEDAHTALRNTFRMLRSGGIFRCIVPDLAERARRYVAAMDQQSASAAHDFMRSCLLGAENRPAGAAARARSLLGNSAHLWMWDEFSLKKALEEAGFISVRRCSFGDSKDPAFNAVEMQDRFVDSGYSPPIPELAMEAVKP